MLGFCFLMLIFLQSIQETIHELVEFDRVNLATLYFCQLVYNLSFFMCQYLLCCSRVVPNGWRLGGRVQNFPRTNTYSRLLGAVILTCSSVFY